jgi:outer membrane protein assembly factor BamB
MRRLFLFLALSGTALGQGRGGGDWMTSGADAQRSSWVRSDPRISRDRMQKGGFGLAWKIKLAEEPTAPVTLEHYIGYRGFRSLAFMGSASGNIVAVDTDLGRVEWQKRLAPAAPPACSAGTVINVTRPTFAGFPPAPGRGGGGGGRGNYARSAVGEPGQGAPIIAELAARAAAAAARGPAPARGAPPPPGIFSPRVLSLDALSSDGMLHFLYVSNGEEPKEAIRFLPPNANASGLIVLDNVAYASTSQSCGGVENGVWALDLSSKEVTHWKGDVGEPAFGGDGTVYAGTTNGELAALEPKTLKLKASYHSGGTGFASAPVVFEFKDKVLLAAAGNDGSLRLLDAARLEGPPLAEIPGSVGALASWSDPAGTRWMLAASRNAIVTWQIADQNGVPALQNGWVSREMISPLSPVIVNGVVFAVSPGDRTTPAVLYAFDGETGKELWNSGNTIASFARNSGLSAYGGQVYLGTSDGTLYAFGFPIEH